MNMITVKTRTMVCSIRDASVISSEKGKFILVYLQTGNLLILDYETFDLVKIITITHKAFDHSRAAPIIPILTCANHFIVIQ